MKMVRYRQDGRVLFTWDDASKTPGPPLPEYSDAALVGVEPATEYPWIRQADGTVVPEPDADFSRLKACSQRFLDLTLHKIAPDHYPADHTAWIAWRETIRGNLKDPPTGAMQWPAPPFGAVEGYPPDGV
jgi:hypothetical protein